MAELVTLSAPELAALLCSKLCHDVISPVGAIENGLELLDEGGSDADALELIRSSARKASARLQFARLAFGATGSTAGQADTGEAERVAAAFLADEKPEFSWEGRRALLAKNKVKLILNMVLVAHGAIPRGGRIHATIEGPDEAPRLSVSAAGPMLRVPPKFLELHSSGTLAEGVDAHTVQSFYTLLLAREAGMEIGIRATPEEIVLSAT